MAPIAVVEAAVLSVVVLTVVLAVVDSAVAHMAEDTAAEDSAVAHTVEDTAAEVAEWVDADKSEQQFPDFRIQHPWNLAH